MQTVPMHLITKLTFVFILNVEMGSRRKAVNETPSMWFKKNPTYCH